MRQAWEYLAADLWEPLARYSTDDREAPEDLFSDLFAAANEYLAPGPTAVELEDARNDPELAKQYFLTLMSFDFESELAIVEFLEEVWEVIADYEIAGYQDLYTRLILGVLQKYNLRYRLEQPFSLRFLLPGSFTNLYSELQRLNTGDTHLAGLWAGFERTFDHYARTQDPTDLKTCIAKVSNYVEGLASVTVGIPNSGNTLGSLSDQLSDWPHMKVKESLKNLYGFCSDYPGIRHAGTPTSARRSLAARDLTLASLLLLGFTGYLSPQIDEIAVLGI